MRVGEAHFKTQDTIDLVGHCGLGLKVETKHTEVYKTLKYLKA